MTSQIEQQTSDLTKRIQKSNDDDDNDSDVSQGEFREYECPERDTLQAVRLLTLTSIDALKKSLDVTDEIDIKCQLEFANWSLHRAMPILRRRIQTPARILKARKIDELELDRDLKFRRDCIAKNLAVIKEEHRKKKLKTKNDN